MPLSLNYRVSSHLDTPFGLFFFPQNLTAILGRCISHMANSQILPVATTESPIMHSPFVISYLFINLLNVTRAEPHKLNFQELRV